MNVIAGNGRRKKLHKPVTQGLKKAGRNIQPFKSSVLLWYSYETGGVATGGVGTGGGEDGTVVVGGVVTGGVATGALPAA